MGATDQGTAIIYSVNAGSVSLSHGEGTYRVAVFVDTRLAVNTLSEWPIDERIPPPGRARAFYGAADKQLVVTYPAPASGEHSVYVWVGSPDGYPEGGSMHGPWYVQAPEPAPGPQEF